ncbi:MAG TPA: transporter substrate-binding domain-containing protein, partial [bacterium]|nr:transporter substrate-binding domain-containing protein [bacterium]
MLSLLTFTGMRLPYAAQIVVTDDKAYPPFAFLDSKGTPRGITIDIWKLWSERTGVAVEFYLMEWNLALDSVREGRADVVAGLFRTPEREADFDFTKPIIKIPTGLFFNRQIPGIRGVEDLDGFQVGVVRGDSAEELLGLIEPSIETVAYPGTDELVKAALSDEIKVLIADAPTVLFYLAQHPRGDLFRQTSEPFTTNLQYAAVRKGNRALLEIIQSGFDQISESDINHIVNEWEGRSTLRTLPWQGIGTAFAGIIFVALVVLVWNLLLRRRVREATDHLAEQNAQLENSRDEIRRSEEQYRLLVESANSIILRMDPLGNVTFFNDFAERFFGFTREEILGRNVVGTIVPKHDDAGRSLQDLILDIGHNP